MIIPAILVIGLSGLIAQVLLLRELLISYLGNELTLGIILANWLISEALGVFIAGKVIDRLRNKTGLFAGLQIIFSLALPVSVYLSRTFKAIIGVTTAEAVSLPVIFYSSFFIILPVAFCHAGLFSCACKILSLNRSATEEEAAGSIAKIYALEITGAITGGFILTYLLLSRFNSFQIAFMVSIASLLVNIPFLKPPAIKNLKYLNLCLSGIFIYLFVSGSSTYLQSASVKRQFGSSEVLDYRNSVYGNIAVVERDRQYTFFYNGLPVITAPFSDITFNEEFGNFPLLLHDNPKKILILGTGAGGLIYELLKYPVEKIDYVELDPLVIAMLRKYLTATTERELSDRRVNIINTDGRIFLRQTRHKYDVILIGFSSPRDLSTNRFFSSEFFSLVKGKIDRGGILSFCLPGSLTYLSNELKNLNASILNAARKDFPYVRVLPGDYNMFFASESATIMDITAGEISRRIDALGIKTNLLVPGYIDYRFNSRWREWFGRSLAGATKKINRDINPLAVFQTLLLWNKQFSGAIAGVLNYLSGLNLKLTLMLVVLIAGAVFLLIFLKRAKRTNLDITYCIATTGFFGMLMSLSMIFIFQIRYGYLYQEIGILTSLFMAGSVAGSIITLKLLRDKNNVEALDLLIKSEAALIVFTLATTLLIRLLLYAKFSYAALLGVSFIAGLFVGWEFPLAGKIYLRQKKQVGETSGSLYFADLFGGCLAGILGGVLLLPVLGLFNACLALALLKSSSLFILKVTKILRR